MTRKEKRRIKMRIESYELRLKTIRSIPGPIDPHDVDAEAYMQSEVNKMRKQLNLEQV
jgi:hypothetical protein